MLSATKCLARARQLQGINESQRSKEAAGDFQAVAILKRTARAIRDELMGRRTGGAADIAVMDPGGTADRVIDHMADLEQSDASLERRAEDSLILREVLKFSERIAVATGDSLKDVRVAWAAAYMEFDAAKFNQHQLSRFTSLASVMKDEDLRYQMEEAAEQYDAAKLQANEAFKARNREVYDRFNEQVQYLTAQIESGELTRAAANERRYTLHTEYNELLKDMNSELARRLEEGKAAYALIGARLHAAIMERSNITEEAAVNWAQAQTITKTAANRLKKMGYPVDEVRRDMAEFQRLTGGRLRTVSIASDGGTRANAEGIHGHGSAVINLGSRFDKQVLWHELGHHLEADPAILAAARGFLAERADGTGLHSMRSLTGNDAYRPNERGYRDSFFNPYVGKHYPDATEVMSMGVESFSNKALLGERMHQDPAMFALIEGILSSEENPLVKLIHEIRSENAEATSEKEASESEVREQATWTIAARLHITPAERPDEIPANQEGYARFVDRFTSYYGITELVGYYQRERTVYVVFRGKRVKALQVEGRSLRWSRPQKGFVIAKLSAKDDPTYVGSNGYRNHAVLGTDLDDVKVAIHVWEVEGIEPRSTASPMELKKYAESA